MMKISFRTLLTFLTLGALFHGVLEIKSFLMVNFVENDTQIKRKFNHALNGFPSAAKPEAKKPEKKR